MIRLLRNPLLHFFAIGAGIYLLYGLYGAPSEKDTAKTLTVTAARIGWLEESWKKRWRRPPTAEERRGLIRAYVRESILYREALAMGLDKDDTIVRRRLAQKLEFLSQDLLSLAKPTEKDLEAHFEADPKPYKAPDLITFAHVFVDPDKRGDRTIADAKAIRAKLEALEPASDGAQGLGDRFMLQRYYPERSRPEISKLFGGEFAKSIFGLQPGSWHGPVLSGYGVHLVYVHDRKQAPPPNFAQVRDRVKQDWAQKKRRELNAQFYESLRARYDVVIEGETPGKGGAAKAAPSK